MKFWDKIKDWALEGNDDELNVNMNAFDYHPKIILAWKVCLTGNKEISKWLAENGYIELVKASAAILGHEDSRVWLMENGYPHLMAFINAIEEEEKAFQWLKRYNYEKLYFMANAINDDLLAWQWLHANASEDVILFCNQVIDLRKRIDDVTQKM